MNNCQKTELLIGKLHRLRDYELVKINNAYYKKTGYGQYIYDMEKIDSMLSGESPLRIIELTSGTCESTDNYFVFCDFPERLESFDFACDYVDIEDIVGYIIENNDDLGNADIMEVLGK